MAKLLSISRLKILTFKKPVKSNIYRATKQTLKEGRPQRRKKGTFSAHVKMIYELPDHSVAIVGRGRELSNFSSSKTSISGSFRSILYIEGTCFIHIYIIYIYNNIDR